MYEFFVHISVMHYIIKYVGSFIRTNNRDSINNDVIMFL